MPNITRKKFLIYSAIGATAIGAIGAYLILDAVNMKKAAEKPGKIFADIHTHPNKNKPLEDILHMLSGGMVGLVSTNEENNILTYDDALELHGTNGAEVRETDKGLFAKITYKSNTGYFFRAQEVMSDHHIFAIGVRDQLEDFPDARKTIEEIQKRGGLAVADHPYVVTTGDPIIKYRLINEQEEKKVRELHEMVDETEVFNGQCINLFPIVAWMHRANDAAKKLAIEYGFKGIASSDAHSCLEQIHTSGIYLPSNTLSIDALKENVKKGNFERHEQYVSKISFLKGHFLG